MAHVASLTGELSACDVDLLPLDVLLLVFERIPQRSSASGFLGQQTLAEAGDSLYYFFPLSRRISSIRCIIASILLLLGLFFRRR